MKSFVPRKNALSRKAIATSVTQKKQQISSFLKDNRSVPQQETSIFQLALKGTGRKDKYTRSTKDYIVDYEDEMNEMYSEEEYDSEDILDAWNPNSDWNSVIAARQGVTQNYTVTFQWTVLGYNIRAHVHHNYVQGAYVKARGNGWISGIPDFQFPTPTAVVHNAPDNPTEV